MLIISNRQIQNKILKYISSPFKIDKDIFPDFIYKNISIIFLSLQYHLCKPEYLHSKLHFSSKKKFLLIFIDLKNYKNLIIELQELAEISNFILLLAFSENECGKFIDQIIKSSEMNLDYLRDKKINQNPFERFLNSFPGINKTDAFNIKNSYSNLAEALLDKFNRLENIPNMGKKKAQLIKKYLNMEF